MKRVTVTHFYRFLDNLGLFGEFWTEYYKVRNGSRKTFCDRRCFQSISPRRFVSSAFPWQDADFGYDFWRNIHLRWLRHIGCEDSK